MHSCRKFVCDLASCRCALWGIRLRSSRNSVAAPLTERNSMRRLTFIAAFARLLTIISMSAALAMALPAASSAPSISKQPASQTVVAGKSATFSVTAGGTAPLSYQWSKNTSPISGATSASYTTPATTASDSGSQFTVTITNTLGSVKSAPATLTVNVPASIVTQPTTQTVVIGQAATFTVVAAGTSPLTYQWKKNGSQISGATLSSYTTPVTAATDNGESFTVTVTNVAGSVTSQSAVLTVNSPPSVTKQPASQTVADGKSATFSVTAAGTAPLSYQWSKNTSPISGATLATYTTPVTSGLDNGSQFTVTVTNSLGSVTSATATLTVNVPPSIVTQPAGQTVVVGQAATFTVVAAGTSPFTYQWKKNGSQIKGATLSSYATPVTTLSNSGESFTVTVTNVAGTATSNAAILTVTPPVPPSITTQPVSQTIVAGQTATFSITATGTAPLSYQWTENGISISGAVLSTYTTPVTATSNSGELFAVRVTNSGGSANSNSALLTVNAPGQLTPSLSSINFGNVLTGPGSNLMVTVTNTGGTTLTILSATVSGAGFSSTGVGGQILAPTQNASIPATFAPAVTGPVVGSIVIASSAVNSPTTISLAGTGVDTGSHSASLSWSESSTNVVGFNVYRGTLSGGPYTLVNPSPVTPTQYLDTDVTAGQTYFYIATAVDSSGNESAASSEASATVPSP